MSNDSYLFCIYILIIKKPETCTHAHSHVFSSVVRTKSLVFSIIVPNHSFQCLIEAR